MIILFPLRVYYKMKCKMLEGTHPGDVGLFLDCLQSNVVRYEHQQRKYHGFGRVLAYVPNTKAYAARQLLTASLKTQLNKMYSSLLQTYKKPLFDVVTEKIYNYRKQIGYGALTALGLGLLTVAGLSLLYISGAVGVGYGCAWLLYQVASTLQISLLSFSIMAVIASGATALYAAIKLSCLEKPKEKQVKIERRLTPPTPEKPSRSVFSENSRDDISVYCYKSMYNHRKRSNSIAVSPKAPSPLEEFSEIDLKK